MLMDSVQLCHLSTYGQVLRHTAKLFNLSWWLSVPTAVCSTSPLFAHFKLCIWHTLLIVSRE